MAPLKQDQIGFLARKSRVSSLKSPSKTPSLSDVSPSKSPRKVLADVTSSSHNIHFDLPLRKPRRIFSDDSPRKVLVEETKSGHSIPSDLTPRKPRRNILSYETPTKSPRKLLSDASPRRSARKILSDDTPTKNVPDVTPRKSPRKASSELTPISSIATDVRTPASSARRQLYARSRDPRLAVAKQALSTAVPDEVVGRKKEVDAMRHFLENAWKRGKKSRSLYISGAPGTGKTACLKNLLANMTMEKPVEEIFINCMGVASSKDIYDRIAKILDDSYDGSQPKKFIEAKICAKSGRPLLLILDEIDQLDCKDQEILYSIFEWPYMKKSRLVLVGIANALDLTDRVLPRLKLSTSITPQQLAFPAYSRQQITDIIVARLKGNDRESIIKHVAIKFLAGKIAAISGDVRKALDVCRRAIELAEIEYQKQMVLSPVANASTSDIKQIDLPQILLIFNQVYSSRVNSSLQNSNSDLPLQQKIIMASLLLMSNYGSRKCKEVGLGKLQETYGRVCKKRKMASLDLSEVASLCSLLESRGFLNVKKHKNIRETKISLRIDENEVEAALQDKTLLTDIINDTTCIAQ